jgi:replicative DNA helicase
MSEDIKFNFDDNFQLGIFELMMHDVSFCEKAVLLLKAEYFKNQYYSWFFQKFEELVTEYKTAPTQLQIKNEILRFPPEKQALYFNIYKKITKTETKRDYNYIKNNLEDFVRKCLRWQLSDILVKNQNKDSDYVDGLVVNKIKEIEKVSFGNATCQSVKHMASIMEESSNQSDILIPTYLPNIDRILGGGVPKHTLTLGLSGTNVGKSIWMMNWAYHLIMNNYKVFYVALEGFEKQTMLRLASRAIGTSFENVRWNRLTDIEMQKRNHFVKNFGDNMQIYYDSSFNFTLEELVEISRQKKEDFDFDVMMVDYGQILKSKRKFSDLRHEQSYIYRSLSSLAGPKDLDCAMVSVAQGTRDTQSKNNDGKGLIRVSDISECFEIIRACATVFTLNRSDNDIEADTARILMDKCRDGKTNVIDICKTNFNRMAFYGSAEEGLGFVPSEDYIQLVK